MENKRNIHYDIIRIIACMMIVAMHSPIPNENANGFFLSALSYLSAPGVGLFFMISGALILPIHTDLKTFFRKRFTKILLPVVIWDMLYLVAKSLVFHQQVDWLQTILSLPFSASGSPVFWFIYTLMGLYLLSPILSKWLGTASKRELQFYLSIWLICLCLPLLKYFVVIDSSSTGILYYFTGYVGYYILGYYIKRYPNSFSWMFLMPALFISIMAPILIKTLKIKIDFYDMFWYLSIFVVVQCVGWWKLIEEIRTSVLKGKIESIVVTLSNLTFGIFLIHIFIMRYILWHYDFILRIDNYYIQTASIIILTFLLSVICTYAISLLPKAQYIIGVKNKLCKM